MPKDKVISVIDVGSSKIATLIASISVEDQIQIIGVSSVPSRGIKKGVVVDIDQAVEGISQSLSAGERMAGYSVPSAYVTINGSQISSINSAGVVAISQPQGEIKTEDISRVTDAAQAISIPNSREIIHVVPRFFSVDSQEGVHDPIGMSGVRLEAQTHIITGAVAANRNLLRCVNQVGVEVEAPIFAGLASAYSILTETEKELGVVLADIGGGTTDVVMFMEGSPAYSAVIPIGGKNITNDLAIGLRVSLDDAEKIKTFISKYKNPVMPGRIEDEQVDIAELKISEVKSVDRRFVRDGIIKPRLEEIFEAIGKEIEKSGFGKNLPSGLVLCGGSALTLGIVETGKKILRMPVRVAQPFGVSGLIDEISSPAYAASIGTIIYAKGLTQPKSVSLASRLPKVGGVFTKVVEFVKGLLP